MAPRPLPVDFREFIDFLNAHDVKYLLVGGWAVGLYGNPRATKDIDFLIAVDDANLRRLAKALHAFGAPTVDISHFKEQGSFFRMGCPPVQIDIITEASGIDIRECYKRKVMIDIEGTQIAVISVDDLIKNKRASGRHQDLADAETLEALKTRTVKKRKRS